MAYEQNKARFWQFRSILTLALLGGLAACGAADPAGLGPSSLREAWNSLNNPALLGDRYQVRFASLPLSGETTKKPWSDTYWPNYRGGLADRWYGDSGADAFTYSLHGAADVAAMSEEQMRGLSPAEKYDIYMGRYEYPLVQYERQRTHANDPGWYGLCHGWAPASINYEEPKPVVVRGPSGVKVPFGSSDVKALLLFAQQYGSDSRTVGERCNSNNNNGGSSPCRDINPGSFHVIIANQIGLLDQPFVAEVNRQSEVWNQPVFGFETEVLNPSESVYPGAAPGTARVVVVRTRMRYIVEMGPNWEAMPFADFPYQETSATYDYTLEISAAGNILGGEWRSSQHPDFVWTQAAPEWSDFFSGLTEIYQASIR